jgi:hypothetical protein
MFCSSQFLCTLFAVRSARPRKKNSAAKNFDVEKKNSLFGTSGDVCLWRILLKKSFWGDE